MRAFFNYTCQSPFAQLYQLAAGGGSPEAVRESFSGLPDNIKNAIYGTVWVEAGRPNTSDPQWGEHHTFDAMPIFYGALKRYVRESFGGLSSDQKNAVYGHVSHLARGEGSDVVSVPGWGRRHAFDNILRLIDAMMGAGVI